MYILPTVYDELVNLLFVCGRSPLQVWWDLTANPPQECQGSCRRISYRFEALFGRAPDLFLLFFGLPLDELSTCLTKVIVEFRGVPLEDQGVFAKTLMFVGLLKVFPNSFIRALSTFIPEGGLRRVRSSFSAVLILRSKIFSLLEMRGFGEISLSLSVIALSFLLWKYRTE